jgi:hypothetical protein
MPRNIQKSVRKLVTLPPELAERVEKFRESSNAPSESEALKTLIEDGLKLRDRSTDLFERFKSAIEKGQTIGEIINYLASDHPLVSSAILDHENLNIYLKSEPDQPDERFSFNRLKKKWEWERLIGDYADASWEPIEPGAPPGRRTVADLDDEIPF